MAEIKPFCAVRFNQENFPLPPVAPPYDIISEKERKAFAHESVHMIHLDKPGNDTDEKRFERSAKHFSEWKQEGILIRDQEPSFYVYAQQFTHPETGEAFERTGFFALLKLEDHYEKHVFPHERTLSAPKADRLNLMRATQAHLSPVFGLYDDEDNKAERIFQEAKKTQPLYAPYSDQDKTEHLIWRVSDPVLITELITILQGKEMIIADGHHRYATALNYRNEMREEHGIKEDAPWEYVLVDFINFNDKGLVILPTHRLLSLDIDKAVLLEKLESCFLIKKSEPWEIEETLLNKGEFNHVLGLSLSKPEEHYLLTLKDIACLDGIVPESSSSEWRTLGVNLLYYVILKHIIAITDEDFETKITYSHSFNETFDIVRDGDVTCTFLLPPSNKQELRKVTQAREVMPQKSTYFFPKIFSGFVIYDHAQTVSV